MYVAVCVIFRYFTPFFVETEQDLFAEPFDAVPAADVHEEG